jgi:hypothetical protein
LGKKNIVMNHFGPTLEQLIAAKMATGRYASEEELLIDALKSLDEWDEHDQGIEEAIADFDRGERFVDLDTAFEGLIAKHNIPPES